MAENFNAEETKEILFPDEETLNRPASESFSEQLRINKLKTVQKLILSYLRWQMNTRFIQSLRNLSENT